MRKMDEIVIKGTNDIHSAIEILLSEKMLSGLSVIGERDWVAGEWEYEHYDSQGNGYGNRLYQYTAADVLKQRAGKREEWEQLNKYFALDEAMAEANAKHLQKSFEVMEVPILNTDD